MYSTPESKKSSDGGGVISSLVVLAIWCGLVFGLPLGGGCSINETRFQSAAKNAGLTKAVQGDYDFFECGSFDVWIANITAKRGVLSPPSDVVTIKVDGTMCCGIFKGCTIRWQ